MDILEFNYSMAFVSEFSREAWGWAKKSEKKTSLKTYDKKILKGKDDEYRTALPRNN